MQLVAQGRVKEQHWARTGQAQAAASVTPRCTVGSARWAQGHSDFGCSGQIKRANKSQQQLVVACQPRHTVHRQRTEPAEQSKQFKSHKTLFTFYNFFLVSFFKHISLPCLLRFSKYAFFKNTENWLKKWAETIPSNILYIDTLLLQAPTSFLTGFLPALAHFLWVGRADALLIRDPLADQVLCGLRSGLRACDGHLPVAGPGDELAFFGDLDPGPSQLLVLH